MVSITALERRYLNVTKHLTPILVTWEQHWGGLYLLSTSHGLITPPDSPKQWASSQNWVIVANFISSTVSYYWWWTLEVSVPTNSYSSLKGEAKYPRFLKSAYVYANLQEYDCGSSGCNRKYYFYLSINNKDTLFQKNV